MPEQIRDGTGSGFLQRVDDQNRAHVDSIQRSELQASADVGLTWNVGTGYQTLGTDNKSAMLYLKNDGVKQIHIDLYIVLTKASTGGSGETLVEIVRNPTSGTIITESPVSISATNMNFGSASAPSATIYSGAEGKTLLGSDDTLRSKTTDDSRLLLGIFTVLPQGSSVGLNVTPPTGNTSMDVEVIIEIFEELVE